MAKRVGLILWLVVGFLAGSVLAVNGIYATGTGNETDPFIVHELTFDASFVGKGDSSNLQVNNISLNTNSGIVVSLIDKPINNGFNSVSITSNWDHNDCCYYACDNVMAVLRIGSDMDGNVIYTQKSGWTPSADIIEYGNNGCIFSGLNVDLPWTDNEKCVNTILCGNKNDYDEDCCLISVSKTFYVKYCACSTPGSCCDGCNYISGSCNDGNLCTLSDYCLAGVCTGSAKDCSSVADQCNSGVCNTGNGTCVKQPISGSCNDGQFCTVSDYCSAGGSCNGSSRDCSSTADQCNLGVCNELTDQCIKQPKTGNCTISGQPGTCNNSGNCIPKPILTVSAYLSPPSINVGDQTTLSGIVTCSNADCGKVYVYPRGSSGQLDVTPGLNVICPGGTLMCAYNCPNITTGNTCNPSWTITGQNPGTYQIFLNAMSYPTSNPSNQSSTINLTVNEIPLGNISITSFSPDSSVITKGSSTTVRANVTCSGTGAKCGNITLSLSYSPGVGLTVIPGSTSCMELKAGKTCPANWTVWGNTLGAYNLYVNAYSDIVDPFMSQSVLNVTDKPFIQINNINLVKNPPIKTGETTALSAEIKCISSSASCGTVKSSLKHNGTAGSLTIQNPEKNCSIMYASSNPCLVSSGITGNAAGTYAIEIVAYSDSLEVQNASVTKVLSVSKNLGNLSVPEVRVTPQVINKSNSATLSATVNCAGYCGNISAQVKVGNVLLNSMTLLSTTDQNPKSCASFPCYLSWVLTGNSVESFDIIVNATSNESLYSINTTNLQVIDPDNPFLGITDSNLPWISKAAPGQAVTIQANVKCITKDCGQTAATLSYNIGAGWIDIDSSGIVYSQSQNPAELGNMNAEDSRDLAWGISFTAEGVYQLRITATGSAPNITNGESKGTINVSQAALVIDIRSPAEGQSFSLGDVIPLKAMITRDDLPASGLSPTVTSALFGYVGIYYSPDGTYTGNASVPSGKQGNYQLVFAAEDYESQVNVYINPVLYVTVNSDKTSYSGGDKIRITGEVKKNNIPAEAMVTLLLSHSSGSWSKEIRLNSTGSYSSEDITVPNIDGEIKITVNAQDSYMNSGQNQTEVSVAARTGDFYNISFALSKYNYSRGEKLSITVKVTDIDFPQAGVTVKCNFFGDVELDEGGTAGLYYGSHAIPFDATIREESLACEAFGAKNGTGFVNIKIEPMSLRISIIEPEPSRYRDTDVISAAPEEPVKLKVKVQYPDGSPVTDAVVEIMLGGDKTNMTQAEPGNYTADVRFTKLGGGIDISTIFLSAQDSQGNQGKSNVGLVVGGNINWWWLLLIPAGLAILFVVYLYMKSKEEAPPPQIQIQEKIIRLPTIERVREIIYRPVRMTVPAKPKMDPVMRLKDEIDRLEEKAQTTQNAKDLAEQQYYKRQIDEATFNKLMQNFEEKLIEIDATVRQKKKQLYEMEPE